MDWSVSLEYFKSVEVLLEKNENGALDYPIIYLFRHVLELSMKLLEKSLYDESENVHDLEVLRNRFINLHNLSGGSLVLSKDQKNKLSKVISNNESISDDFTINDIEEVSIDKLFNICEKYNFDSNNTRYRFYQSTDVSRKEKFVENIKLDFRYLRKLQMWFLIIAYDGISKDTETKK